MVAGLWLISGLAHSCVTIGQARWDDCCGSHLEWGAGMMFRMIMEAVSNDMRGEAVDSKFCCNSRDPDHFVPSSSSDLTSRPNKGGPRIEYQLYGGTVDHSENKPLAL